MKKDLSGGVLFSAVTETEHREPQPNLETYITVIVWCGRVCVTTIITVALRNIYLLMYANAELQRKSLDGHVGGLTGFPEQSILISVSLIVVLATLSRRNNI